MRRTATAVPNSIENVPFFDSFKVAKVLRKRLPNILTWFKHRISNSRIQQQASVNQIQRSRFPKIPQLQDKNSVLLWKTSTQKRTPLAIKILEEPQNQRRSEQDESDLRLVNAN
ncbi:MAG: hypothetical protein NTW75_08935 [Planctomycetales bacterium]|nr:hypothetical protein [Planctomycetales bacterium]